MNKMATQKKVLAEQPANLEAASASNPPARPAAEAEVTDAINRVYRHYGRNLSAFFNDVRREAAHPSEQFPLLHTVPKQP
jgi:hypothetical protein